MAEGREKGLSQRCPLCAGVDHERVSRRGRDGRPLDTVLCIMCGHVFNSPIPSVADLRTYYHQAYRAEYKGVVRPKARHVLRAGIRALERLAQLRTLASTSARLLDVGAGGGEFIYLAGKAGFAARGIEPHQGYAEQARAMLGVDVVNAAMQDAAVPEESIDVVTIHHVLEHLPDPRAALSRIWQWLTPGGLLIVEVPNVASRYHAPRRRFHRAHIHAFNETGLNDAVTNAGFTAVASTVVPETEHLNLVARRSQPAATPSWRATASQIRAQLAAHTVVAHAMSGRPLRRLWANAKRPIVESYQLLRLSDRSPRGILDHIWKQKCSWTESASPAARPAR